MKHSKVLLPYRPPLHWETLLNFFRVHEMPGLETVGENSYGRVFRQDGKIGAISVAPSPRLEHELELNLSFPDDSILPAMIARIRRMFDLDADPGVIAKHFDEHPVLGEIGRKHRGLRHARAWDPFEGSIATILGQLVSLAQARRLVGQVVSRYGEKVRHPVTGADAFLFPTPETLAAASLDEVGTTGRRKITIREFSRRVSEGLIDLANPPPPAELKKQLLDVPGIGPWSAEYILLRAIGHPDAFPGTDLILQRVLDRFPDIDFNQASPWRAYAAVYLWKEYAAALAKSPAKGDPP